MFLCAVSRMQSCNMHLVCMWSLHSVELTWQLHVRTVVMLLTSDTEMQHLRNYYAPLKLCFLTIWETFWYTLWVCCLSRRQNFSPFKLCFLPALSAFTADDWSRLIAILGLAKKLAHSYWFSVLKPRSNSQFHCTCKCSLTRWLSQFTWCAMVKCRKPEPNVRMHEGTHAIHGSSLDSLCCCLHVNRGLFEKCKWVRASNNECFPAASHVSQCMYRASHIWPNHFR